MAELPIIPIMYIFANGDLRMNTGKTAAQVGHIVGIIIEEIVRIGYEVNPPPKQYFDFCKWKRQCTKVILKATTEQLQELMKMDNARPFYDSGDRLPDNSLTVVGFFPGTDLTEIVKNYKLI